MAVEARHLNFFPSQIIGSTREIMNAIENNPTAYNNNKKTDFGLPLLSGTTVETLLPFYNSVVVDSVQQQQQQQQQQPQHPMKAESGLTCNIPSSSLTRKRCRDPINPPTNIMNPIISYSGNVSKDGCCNNNVGAAGFTFLGEDISFQIQQQQLEIDRLIAHHTEKLLVGIAERRKRHARRVVESIEEGIMKRLKAKEEEIEKMGKLNWVLEERVKTLCFENQIWRDLAQTNEATANALRVNLEQLLSKVRDDGLATADDAASSCGSSDFDEKRESEDVVDDNNNNNCNYNTSRGSNSNNNNNNMGCNSNGNSSRSRWCRNCGKEESCVLLLPCRHLCLCSICGPALHSCPICKSDMNGTVNVNMS